MRDLLHIAAYAVSVLLLVVMALLSVRGIVDPAGAAASFGVPVDDPSAYLYQLVYRSRNLVIAVAGLAFLFFGMWRALAILATVAIALPAFDIYALTQAGREVTVVHPATLVALAIMTILLWLRLALNRPEKN
ncbi:MAG: hypothetical protein DCF16_18080 [Alphaproteobacteria bacterium]|nr:MAG: hypothetical protein DCF16_18080 [Alphaproteobacteria bacterium]